MRDGMGIFKGLGFILLPFVLLSILAVSEDIGSLNNETLINETLTNETLANETLANETLANETLANETLANETLANEILINETLANPENSSVHSDTATEDFQAPAVPTDLTGIAVKNGLRYTVTLNWIDNANNENGFQIQRAISPNFIRPTSYTVGADVTSFINQNVPSYSQGYYYRVKATNALGNSGWSEIFHVDTP